MMKHIYTQLLFLCAGVLLLQCPVIAVERMEKRDYYAFPNSASAFFQKGEDQVYSVSERDLLQFQRNLERLYPGNAAPLYAQIKEFAKIPWGGSCYGIAVTEGIYNENPDHFSLEKPSKAKAPKYDEALRSYINYYFLTQYIPRFRQEQHWGCEIDENTFYPERRVDWREDLQSLADEVRKNPVLLSYGFPMKAGNGTMFCGHAIIVEAVEPGENGTYRLKAQDNRFPGMDTTIVLDMKGNGELTLYYPGTLKGHEKILMFEYTGDFSAYANDMPYSGDAPVLTSTEKNHVEQIVIDCDTNWSMSVGNSFLEMSDGRIPQGDGTVSLRKIIGKSQISPAGKPLYEPATLIYDVPGDSEIVFTSLATDVKQLPENEESFHLSYLTEEGCLSVTADYAAGAVLSPEGVASVEDVKGEVSITSVNGDGDSIYVEARGGGGLSDDFTVTPIDGGANIAAPEGELFVTSAQEGEASVQKTIVCPKDDNFVVVEFPDAP